MKLHNLVLIALSLFFGLFAFTACDYSFRANGNLNAGTAFGPGVNTDIPDAVYPSLPDNDSSSLKNADTLILSLVNSLNVRSGKGTNYPSLGTLDKGDMVSYIATEDGWYKTVYKQQTAYISANENYTALFYMEKSSDKIESVISVAKTLLGYPYVWGAQRYHWGNGNLNPVLFKANSTAPPSPYTPIISAQALRSNSPRGNRCFKEAMFPKTR